MLEEGGGLGGKPVDIYIWKWASSWHANNNLVFKDSGSGSGSIQSNKFTAVGPENLQVSACQRHMAGSIRR